MRKRFAIWIAAILILTAFSAVGVAAAEEPAASPTYKIQGHDNNTGDYIISAVNVKEFGAVGDGKKDDTEAFFSALEKAGELGGGTVFVPAGIYKISAPLSVPALVTLRGQWNNPLTDANQPETILVANFEGGSATGEAFITLGGKATARDLKIYYQKQDAESVKPFPYTLRAGSFLCNFINLTLVNSYNGIDCSLEFGGSAQYVDNIFGTILNQGVIFDHNYEVSIISNIHFSSAYWNEYDGSDRAQIQKVTTVDAMPLRLGKADDSFLYEINLDPADYKKGIYFFKNPESIGQSVTYGMTYKIHGAKIMKDVENDNPRVVEIDKIGDAASKPGHVFATDRYSTVEKLYNVRNYGAKGDSKTDDSNAVILAIQAADKTGGGIVFFPPGNYKITKKLEVKPNIELKGEWDGPYMFSPASLLMYYGKGMEDDAMIELEENSGVHGLTFRLPEFTPQNIEPYAWLIRGKGSNTYIEYVTPMNTYNAFNFYDYKCDHFLVKGTYGTAMHTGLKMGGGSVSGRTENTFFSYGPWWEEINRNDDGALREYSIANAEGYIFGDVKDMSCFSVNTYGLSSGIRFEEQSGKSPVNIKIYRALLDVPNAHINIEFNAGNNISVFGLSSPSVGGICAAAGDTLNGKVRIYGQNRWGGTWVQKNEFKDKDVIVYNEGDGNVQFIKHKFSFPEQNDGISAITVAWIVSGSVVGVALIGFAVLLAVKKLRKKVLAHG